MAPLETWRAKRRWTLGGKKAQLTGNSDSSYGEEILPTIDTNALEQLPRDEQKKFIDMRKQDRKNVLRRWKKEGKHIPTMTETVTAAKSTTSLARRSPPPQLPQLKMDVSKNSLSTTFQPHRFFGQSSKSGASQRTPVTGDTPIAKPANTQAPGRYAARVAQKLASGKGWMMGQLKGKKRMDAVPSERPASGSRSHGEVEVGVARKVSVTRAPVVVMNTQSGDRQTGRKAQLSNITAAKTVADIIRSCLGPNAMLKMLLDPMGGIALTNDGHAILREIEVAHPAAKNMIELSRTQDEEVGDGTTTVIILAGEILAQALPQLERNIHPVVIISAFKRALNDALNIVDKVSMPVNVNDDESMYRLISSAIDTKYAARWSKMMCSIALKAVRTVSHDVGGGKKEVDIKRYAKVEKVPGGQIEDSRVLDGVMLNKDITHPKMRRRIENPRVVLLDCPLEYKKGESQTNIEISKEDDWNRILQIEEEQIKVMTDAIVALKPDVVITEKGVSDLAQHFLVKHKITALRRVRKTDNNRIARATGATIVNRVEDLRESDVGTQCGLFEIEKIGDEYFTFITKCKGPKACTILLRGPSKDILNEIERNLQDAMFVARNVVFHPRLSPGGGATEMAVSVRLAELAKEVEGVQQWPYKAVAEAMEVIPRTLIQNSGSSPIRVLTKLRAKHAEGQHTWGVDGYNGTLVDMKQYGTWEPEAVKLQSIKTAIENACLLLRVDDICSAKSAKQSGGNMGETED
ncbi:MAG: hypothetical protein LQ350_003363 [Teloschistes chrysophthalmus]|nr:MAG: hypothetical protein LQ350_003363 [Niorma chrysophthalma]